MLRLPVCLFALVMSVFAPAAVLADSAASDWARTDQVDVRLVSAVAGPDGNGDARLGLHFRMAEGWKIYWRTPGDAGFPPAIDWEGSANLQNAAMAWPAPKRFELFGLQNYGYAGEVVLPVTATVADPSAPLRLRARVDYLTCNEICIPHTANLSLDLPQDGGAATPFAHLIGRYAAQVPAGGEAAGFAVDRVQVSPAGGGAELAVALRSAFAIDNPDLFVEGPNGLEFLAPAIAATETGGHVLRVPVRGDNAFAALARAPLTLTVVDGNRSAEITARAEPGAAQPAYGWLAILGLALLGGLILNLMPCVLPVLSLKLLGVISLGGAERGPVRRAFLATAAGIVVSFLALAGALIGLQAAGAQIGWGIQFQQPVFLSAMIVVLVLFAANLFGAFEISLPGRVAALGTAGPQRGLGGDFLTGAFATLLATPCSAPFLGTAVGFALARGPVEILAIFAALGVGLALPYLLVAARPAMVAMLPRPGPWMAGLRRILGLALAGTAVWLGGVLLVQTGVPAVLAVAAAALLIAGALALRASRSGAGRRLAEGAAGVLVVAALAAPALLPAAMTVTPAVAGPVWQPLDRAAIPGLIAEGKTVFVDVTADWCVTCKVNKTLVLDSPTVAARLTAPDVVAMRGDWTSPDPVIADYLAGFGRYGIPFNAVYGPNAPAGKPFPELLSVDAVMAGFDAAGNN